MCTSGSNECGWEFAHRLFSLPLEPALRHVAAAMPLASGSVLDLVFSTRRISRSVGLVHSAPVYSGLRDGGEFTNPYPGLRFIGLLDSFAFQLLSLGVRVLKLARRGMR